MALTPSSMLELGTRVPDFSLRDVVSNRTLGPKDVLGKNGFVVMFICCHCPYVIHVQKELARIADEYALKGVGFVAISSNDVGNYPQDSPEHMVKQAKEIGFHFPYLYDETQEVAKEFQAECTPDIFVFDAKRELVYRGRLDEATPGNDKPVNGKDLRNALTAMVEGNEIAEDQFPSMGCNIKWRV